MPRYKVVFKPSVEKDLRSLPKSVFARVFRRVHDLEDNPLPYGAIKLSGAEDLYRIRIGDYRVIYGIDKQTMRVLVHYIRHRRDVYRGF